MSVPERNVRFEYLDGLEVSIRVAHMEHNAIFRAGVITWVQPLTLAASLPEGHPRRLSEEQALEVMAKLYGMGVMAGSRTNVQLDQASPDDWSDWLLEHPDEFELLRSVAPIPENFGLDEAAPKVPIFEGIL